MGWLKADVDGGVAQTAHAIAYEDLAHDVVETGNDKREDAGDGKFAEQSAQTLRAEVAAVLFKGTFAQKSPDPNGIIFYGKGPLEAQPPEGLWSEWRDSNARSPAPKEYREPFYNIFRTFIAVSAPFDMLFGTLRPRAFHVVQPQLWQNMWSKTLPGLGW